MAMPLLVLLAALLAQREGELPRQRPPSAHYQPIAAVDHVAFVQVDEGHGPNPISRYGIVRAGTWLRIGETFSDFASGTTISYGRDAQGRFDRLSISRHHSGDTYHRFRRDRTGARDEALGETCEVWNATCVGEREGEGINWLSCETVDGIELWSRAESARDGTVLRVSRTLSFERRPVSADEVRPPRDLLRWAYWRELGPPVARVRVPVGQPSEFEVRLRAASDRGQEVERIQRRRGDWYFWQSKRRDGTHYLTVDNGAIAFNYESERNGRPVSLHIQRKTPTPVAGEFRYVPEEPRRTEEVLGEQCFWAREQGAELVITSGSHGQCVTADALPLRVASHHRVWFADLTATRISRAPPPMVAMMPPGDAFRWAAWGVRIGR